MFQQHILQVKQLYQDTYIPVDRCHQYLCGYLWEWACPPPQYSSTQDYIHLQVRSDWCGHSSSLPYIVDIQCQSADPARYCMFQQDMLIHCVQYPRGSRNLQSTPCSPMSSYLGNTSRLKFRRQKSKVYC